MSDACYELIADYVDPSAWHVFCQSLSRGFSGFPLDWSLKADLAERLLLRIQFHYFNPDLVTSAADKRARSWAFMSSFLDAGFQHRFMFLRNRLAADQQRTWDLEFANFENLLYLSAMTEDMRGPWLSGFEARVKYGNVSRAKVIKTKGLGLESKLMGVHILMTWPEIKTRFRFLLKRHHPDVGGDPAFTQQLITEFKRLQAAYHQQTSS